MFEPGISMELIVLVIALLSLVVKVIVDRLKPIIRKFVGDDQYNSYAIAVLLAAVLVAFGLSYALDLEPVAEFIATPNYEVAETLIIPILNAVVIAVCASVWHEAPEFLLYLFSKPSLGDAITTFITAYEEIGDGASTEKGGERGDGGDRDAKDTEDLNFAYQTDYPARGGGEVE